MMRTTHVLLLMIFVVAAVAGACKSPPEPAIATPDAAQAAVEPSSGPAAGPASGPADQLTLNGQDDIKPPPDEVPAVGTKVEISDEEWKVRLTPKQFYILREAGTERSTTGAYNKFYEDGVYHCSACNSPLFSSKAKYDSHTGWPSFYEAVEDGRVGQRPDNKFGGLPRTEIFCTVCGGHLGHVFKDGPEPSGDRFCVNSASLFFRPEAE